MSTDIFFISLHTSVVYLLFCLTRSLCCVQKGASSLTCAPRYAKSFPFPFWSLPCSTRIRTNLEESVVMGKLSMIMWLLGKMVSKMKIGDLIYRSFSPSPFLFWGMQSLASFCMDTYWPRYPLLCVLLCFFITPEASSQITEIVFGLPRLCLVQLNLDSWKCDFRSLWVPVRALYWSRQQGQICW